MNGLQDEENQAGEAARQQAQDGDEAQRATPLQVTGADAGVTGGGAVQEFGSGVAGDGAEGDAAAHARAGYEAALAERDARIAELESEIAQAAKSAESAEKLRAEIEELRRQGDEQRTDFELRLAGARSVRAARVLLDEHGGDVAELKAAEPWLFGVSAPTAGAAAGLGATGLPNAGAATDEGARMRRWRRIAGIEDEEE